MTELTENDKMKKALALVSRKNKSQSILSLNNQKTEEEIGEIAD